MKKFYEHLSKSLIIMLVAIIPLGTFAQTTPTKADVKKKDSIAAKAQVKKIRDLAPTNTYWSVTAYGALNQFNGDLFQESPV